MIYLDTYDAPVGALSLASDGPHLCGLWLDGQKYYEEKFEQRVGAAGDEASALTRLAGPEARAAAPGLQAAVAWLDRYFDGADPGPLPPLALHGTPFQEEVWARLCAIPYGRLTTYGALADEIALARGGGKVSARAVGVAVGRNPVSIVVPCHRVVGAGGSLTGYAGGIERKKRLLSLEGVDVAALKVPKKGTAL